MDSSHKPQQQSSQSPPEPTALQPLYNHLPPSTSLPLRTASSTPVSSPGLFSPTASRHNLTALPYTSVSECNTPAPIGSSPFLHPLQTHRVRETHKALIDSDNITGRKIINQYEVIEEIGRGMHGKVKLARSLETSDNVAIKIIPRFSKKRRLGKVMALSPQDKTKKEIAILKKIRHPNVVALLEVIDDPELKKIYMVLEHVELGEIVWRKKGLPHICQCERRRVEREMGCSAPSAEEEQYNQLLERRQAIKELKRAKMAQTFAGPSDYWSVEHGAADEGSSASHWSRISSHENFALTDGPSSRSGSRRSSVAPSRSMSIASTGLMASELAEDVSWVDDMETPGPLHSAPGSTTALDSIMGATYTEDGPRREFRERSPSMADSIISHMSSVDYNPYAHDPFAEDYSFVPCFTFEKARSTFRDTVLGLEYLHYQGVVHRDIKPANLLWTRDHRVKISDFGVSYFGRPIRDGEADDTVSESEAKDFDDDLELAKTVGTPAFFAPELCYTDIDSKHQPKVSEQIDVWSLGVTLYCLIFARIPFLAEDEFQMFRKIANEDVHIPRRRLKPVDPSTSPVEHSLFKRQNAHPYRDDNDLEYEDVDNLLHDLLRQMLTKNPEKRIRLRDIKRHPWVVHGLSNVAGWLDETDPARPSQGRKIQVDEKEMSYAVVPLTFLERARSVVKKAVGRVMHPLVERADSKPRRRAASSVASSTGDSIYKHGGAGLHPSFERRSSLRVEDYFPGATKDGLAGSDQPATTSPSTATVQADTAYDPLATVLQPVEGAKDHRHHQLWSAPENNDDGNGGCDFSASSACARRFQRHVGHRKMAPQFLQLAPALPATQSTPATPHADVLEELPQDGSRRSRAVESQSEDNSRSASVERGLFRNADKHANGSCSVSTATASGTMHRHSGPIASLDLGRGSRGGYSTPSPLSSSPRANAAAYRHGQPRSDSNLKNRCGFGLNAPQIAVAQAHRARALTSLAEKNGCTSTSPETETTQAVVEPLLDSQILSPPKLEPANVPCPPSPEQAAFSRGDALNTTKSSSLESMDGMGTPLTSPSETTSPLLMERPKTVSGQLLVFQSDPSLPALLSGASSVSADMEAELLARSGVGGPTSRYEGSSEAITPPALVKEPTNGFPMTPMFEHTQSLAGDSSLHLQLGHDRSDTPEDLDSPTPRVDEDDDSDDGIFLMAKSKKKASPTSASHPPRPFEAKRRDTGASTASDETAKKVSVYCEDYPRHRDS
ncbi:Calcium/calmodulin-dependent/calcium-dependent protein kinase [Metarhizium album ARSEF 1941]|uniref:non-specific serine/threonine protein kinase n=1 Tax=Metarhizium album (strain ARSEF 1941) TaxID=1081103 RepID=A0A0B2WHL5_METAS|nr:Calcium/calmodulin-dependent/calcium-dependent protein kinase [Metarhizium album ARSEF 1941]KHN95506.1 Calcium/calmodulin-dependent/calcium-dependent protein kinase [Metarhizium album ARSEF 1941]